MTTLRITNTHPHFYQLLGPFLARRDVVAAVGGPVWDDEGKVWSVALDAAGVVAGFIGVTVKGEVATVCSGYVPAARADAAEVWAAILADALDGITGRAAVARATVGDELGAFRKAGFKKARDTGRFAVVEKAVR